MQIKNGAPPLQGPLAEHGSVSRGLLDTLRLPLMLVTGSRKLLHANPPAMQMLSRADPVRALDGSLACLDPQSEKAFESGLAALFAPAGPPSGEARQARRLVSLRCRDGRPVPAVMLALRRGRAPVDGRDRRLVLLAIAEPEAAGQENIMEMTFGLTPAEARIAAMIAAGRAPNECAARLDVRISTVRSQLASIYQKTGATGRADLVRLVFASTVI
jgi:DNA-binding CsgD family transcriptional regulator